MPRFELIVESGSHEGLRHPHEGGAVTIGSGLEADLVLFEDALEPVHLRLDDAVEGGARRRLVVVALGPHVRLTEDGAAPRDLAVDETVEARLPLALTIGDPAGAATPVALALRPRLRPGEAETIETSRALVTTRPEEAAAPPPAAPSGSPWTPVLVTLPLVVLLLATQFVDWGGSPPSDPAAVPVALPPGAVPSSTPRPRTALAPVPARDALAALRERLDARDLASIDLRLDGDVIIASGGVPEARREIWNAVQRWFDGAHGDTAVLISQVPSGPVRAEAPTPPIEAAWIGADPYVVSRGRRYRPGDALGRDWTLVEIGPTSALLRREDRDVRVRY